MTGTSSMPMNGWFASVISCILRTTFPIAKWVLAGQLWLHKGAYEAGNLNETQSNIFRNPCPEEELFQVGKDPHQARKNDKIIFAYVGNEG